MHGAKLIFGRRIVSTGIAESAAAGRCNQDGIANIDCNLVAALEAHRFAIGAQHHIGPRRAGRTAFEAERVRFPAGGEKGAARRWAGGSPWSCSD